MTVFECRVVGGMLQVDGVETLEAGYFSADAARRLSVPAWAEVVLPDAFEHCVSARFQPAQWRPPLH